MSEGMDFSKAIEAVQQMLTDENGQEQIQNILNMFTNDSENEKQSDKTLSLPALQNTSNPFDMADVDMLFKIKKIMSAMNAQNNSAQAEFLSRLKPLLKSNRREKLDQALKIMNMAKVFKIVKDMNEGGG